MIIRSNNVKDFMLEIKNFSLYIKIKNETMRALKNISFTVRNKDITCVVGRSGSGKSMMVKCLSGIIPSDSYMVGSIFLNEDKENIFTIFQDPMNSFNPAIKMGNQLYEFAGRRRGYNKKQFLLLFSSILEEFGFIEIDSLYKMYSFQMSGGMLQRLMIACAVFIQPKLLMADEPTSALNEEFTDKFVENILKLKKKGCTVLIITHDVYLVSQIADEVIVMKDGELIEKGSVEEVFKDSNTLIYRWTN